MLSHVYKWCVVVLYWRDMLAYVGCNIVVQGLFSPAYFQFSSVQFSSVQFSSVQLLTILLLSHITIHFSSIQFSSVQFSSVQISSFQISSVQFSSVQFSSVQFSSAILCRREQALSCGSCVRNVLATNMGQFHSLLILPSLVCFNDLMRHAGSLVCCCIVVQSVMYYHFNSFVSFLLSFPFCFMLSYELLSFFYFPLVYVVGSFIKSQLACQFGVKCVICISIMLWCYEVYCIQYISVFCKTIYIFL